MGAGFYIEKKVVVTAKHVVDGCTKATIENNNDQSSTGVVVIKETKLDIAFINVVDNIAPVVEIDTGAHLKGEVISIVGAPIDGLVLSSGKIKNHEPTSDGFRLTLDVPADHGNSGGPIFSEQGLIGLIVAKSEFGDIYGYDEAQISEVLALKNSPRTQDVQMIMDDNSELESLLFSSMIVNALFLVTIIVLFAKRKRYNKNQVVINL
jgi:hypothetical protein